MYLIRKDVAPVTIRFDDFAYDVNPKDLHTNAAPINGTVFKIDNSEVHTLLNFLTQDTKYWKWIDKSKGGRDYMKAPREHYNGSAESKRHMNITKTDLKELYFK